MYLIDIIIRKTKVVLLYRVSRTNISYYSSGSRSIVLLDEGKLYLNLRFSRVALF